MTSPSPTCRFTVRLQPAQQAELERVARAHECTASQEVRDVLAAHLAQARRATTDGTPDDAGP